MKILAFILSVFVSTLLVLGGTTLIVIESLHHPVWIQLLGIFALSVLVYGPLMLGSLTAYWNTGKSTESRRYFRRILLIVFCVEAAAAIAIVAFSLLAAAPVWVPALFIVGGAALTAVSLPVGRLVLRHEESRPQPDSWTPISRREVLRKVVAVAITFVVTFVVAMLAIVLIIAAILGRGSDRAVSSLGTEALFAVEFACFAAGFVCVLATIPLNRRLRDAVGRDLGTIRKVSKVVLRKKDLHLDQDEQVAAAKLSAIVPTTMTFMFSYLILLYAGLGIQQGVSIASGIGGPLNVFISIFLVVVVVVFAPVYAVRIRRAREYARVHSDLLPDADPTPA